MADAMPMPVLTVSPRGVKFHWFTEHYKTFYIATRLIGEARLRSYWEEQLRRTGQSKLPANKTFEVKKRPIRDANGEQAEEAFRTAHVTCKKCSLCLEFALKYKLSVPLLMVDGVLNIPANIQVVVKRPDFVPDAPANVNELSVWPMSLHLHKGNVWVNRKLAWEMLNISDEELVQWWKASVGRSGFCVLLARSKVMISRDPRINPQLPFSVQMTKRRIEYKIVYEYSENLVLLDGDQLPDPTIIRVQKTVLE